MRINLYRPYVEIEKANKRKIIGVAASIALFILLNIVVFSVLEVKNKALEQDVLSKKQEIESRMTQVAGLSKELDVKISTEDELRIAKMKQELEAKQKLLLPSAQLINEANVKNQVKVSGIINQLVNAVYATEVELEFLKYDHEKKALNLIATAKGNMEITKFEKKLREQIGYLGIKYNSIVMKEDESTKNFKITVEYKE